MLKPEAHHQGSKNPFTDFRWTGSYFVERTFPIKNYSLHRTGTNKTQVLHRMTLRPFTSDEHLFDIRVMSQEWKPDHEVTIKHDDLYARAWQSDFGKPFFDYDQDERRPPNPREMTVEHDRTNSET